MQGIYCIENTVTGKKYYSSSMNVRKRLLQHQQDLKKGNTPKKRGAFANIIIK